MLDSHKPALTNTMCQTIHFESSELYNTQNMYTNVHVHKCTCTPFSHTKMLCTFILPLSVTLQDIIAIFPLTLKYTSIG